MVAATTVKRLGLPIRLTVFLLVFYRFVQAHGHSPFLVQRIPSGLPTFLRSANVNTWYTSCASSSEATIPSPCAFPDPADSLTVPYCVLPYLLLDTLTTEESLDIDFLESTFPATLPACNHS